MKMYDSDSGGGKGAENIIGYLLSRNPFSRTLAIILSSVSSPSIYEKELA